jgi:hypothetical protein
VAVTIEEAYNDDLANRDSAAFKTLAKSLSNDIVNMYSNAYRDSGGRFMANILAFEYANLQTLAYSTNYELKIYYCYFFYFFSAGDCQKLSESKCEWTSAALNTTRMRR